MRIFSNENGKYTTAIDVDENPVKITWDGNHLQMTFLFLTDEEKTHVELTACFETLGKKEQEIIEHLMDNVDMKMSIIDEAFWIFDEVRYLSDDMAAAFVYRMVFGWRN